MNSRVENVGRRTPDLARDQAQSRFGINRRFVFGQHNQCRAALIEPRVHTRSSLYATRERKPNMYSVPHFVRSERAFNFADDFFAWRNFGEGQRPG